MADTPSPEVIVERIDNLGKQIAGIDRKMATKDEQLHVADDIRELTAALAAEKTAREAGDKEVAREAAARLEHEVVERKAIASRLQTVEDRMEARKYQFFTSIALSGIAALFAFGAALLGPIIGR